MEDGIVFEDDYDFILSDERRHLKKRELPEYLRKAMEKEGVVRNSDGKFVKVR